MTVAAAGPGQLVGYWGFPCPNGPSTHLASIHVSSNLDNFEVITGPPYGPDTPVKMCPDCFGKDADGPPPPR